MAVGVVVPTVITALVSVLYFHGPVWDFLVHDHATAAWRSLVVENLTLWFLLFGSAHCLLYLEPQRSFFAPFKFNPAYPPSKLVVREFMRSVRGVLIGTCYEVAINRLFIKGILPTSLVPTVLIMHADDSTSMQSIRFIVGGLLLYLWGDCHFYWTHRLLHTPWLYKNVHKEHHESFNPDPFSGLSMHWFESAVYFSAAPLISFAAPLWLFRLLVKGLIVFPLPGHSGHGNWAMEASYNHYVHHSKFNW